MAAAPEASLMYYVLLLPGGLPLEIFSSPSLPHLYLILGGHLTSPQGLELVDGLD